MLVAVYWINDYRLIHLLDLKKLDPNCTNTNLKKKSSIRLTYRLMRSHFYRKKENPITFEWIFIKIKFCTQNLKILHYFIFY